MIWWYRNYRFQVENLEFSLESGYFVESKEITITCPTPEIEIRYTIDNTEPDSTSLLYTEPFIIDKTTVIKAHGFRKGWLPNQSSIFEYVIPSMVFVEAGSFSMGNNYYVNLSSFYISMYEITQKEWYDVMYGNNNSISNSPSFFESHDFLPVERVSYFDAIVYCNRRSIKECLEPFYIIAGTTNPNQWGAPPTSSIMNENYSSIERNFSANGYRLPSEAQCTMAFCSKRWNSFSGL